MSAPPTSLRTQIENAIIRETSPADDRKFRQCELAADAVLAVLRTRVEALPARHALVTHGCVARSDVLALLGAEQ